MCEMDSAKTCFLRKLIILELHNVTLSKGGGVAKLNSC